MVRPAGTPPCLIKANSFSSLWTWARSAFTSPCMSSFTTACHSKPYKASFRVWSLMSYYRVPSTAGKRNSLSFPRYFPEKVKKFHEKYFHFTEVIGTRRTYHKLEKNFPFWATLKFPVKFFLICVCVFKKKKFLSFPWLEKWNLIFKVSPDFQTGTSVLLPCVVSKFTASITWKF